MRIRFSSHAAICGLLLVGAAPAAATKLDQVRSLCAKNPNCHAIPQDPRYGGQDFCIDSKPGGSACETVVWCPGDGSDCGVIGIVAGRRKLQPNLSLDAVLLNAPR